MKIIEFCTTSLSRFSPKEVLLTVSSMITGITLLVLGVISSLQILPLGLILCGIGIFCSMASIISTAVICVQRNKKAVRIIAEEPLVITRHPLLEEMEKSYQNASKTFVYWQDYLPQLEDQRQKLADKKASLKPEIEELEREFNQARLDKGVVDKEVLVVKEELDALRAPGWTGWLWSFWDAEAAKGPGPIDINQLEGMDLDSLTAAEKVLIDKMIPLKDQQRTCETKMLDLRRNIAEKKTALSETKKELKSLKDKVKRLKTYLITLSNYMIQLNEFIQNTDNFTTASKMIPDAPAAFEEDVVGLDTPCEEAVVEKRKFTLVDPLRVSHDPVFNPQSPNVVQFTRNFKQWLDKDLSSMRHFVSKVSSTKTNMIIKGSVALRELTTHGSLFNPIKKLITMCDQVGYRNVLCVISTDLIIKEAFKEAIRSLYDSMDNVVTFILFMNFVNNAFISAQVKQPFSQQEAEEFCAFLGISIERYDEAFQQGDCLTLLLKDICGIASDPNETLDPRGLKALLETPENKPSLMEGLRLAGMQSFIKLYQGHLDEYQNYDSPTCKNDIKNIVSRLGSVKGLGEIALDIFHYEKYRKSRLFTTQSEYPLSFLKVLFNSPQDQKAMRKGLKWIPLSDEFLVSAADTFVSLCFHYGAFDHQNGAIKEQFYSDLSGRVHRKSIEHSISKLSFLKLIMPYIYRAFS